MLELSNLHSEKGGLQSFQERASSQIRRHKNAGT